MPEEVRSAAALPGPLHPSRSHLQPPTGFVPRRPGHLCVGTIPQAFQLGRFWRSLRDQALVVQELEQQMNAPDTADELNFLSCSNLAREEKRLRISAFTAKFERAKVFVPRSLEYIWFRLYPNSQSIEILQTDLAIMHTLYQMGTNRRRQM